MNNNKLHTSVIKYPATQVFSHKEIGNNHLSNLKAGSLKVSRDQRKNSLKINAKVNKFIDFKHPKDNGGLSKSSTNGLGTLTDTEF